MKKKSLPFYLIDDEVSMRYREGGFQVLTESLDQWAVKFRVSFGRPNCRTNVLETEARSARVAGSLLLHYFRGSSEFSIEFSKFKVLKVVVD